MSDFLVPIDAVWLGLLGAGLVFLVEKKWKMPRKKNANFPLNSPQKVKKNKRGRFFWHLAPKIGARGVGTGLIAQTKARSGHFQRLREILSPTRVEKFMVDPEARGAAFVFQLTRKG